MRQLQAKMPFFLWLLLALLLISKLAQHLPLLLAVVLGGVAAALATHLLARYLHAVTGFDLWGVARHAAAEIALEKKARAVLTARRIFAEDTPRGYLRANSNPPALTITVPVGYESTQIVALAPFLKDALGAYSVRAVSVDPGRVRFAIYYEDALDLKGEVVPVSNPHNGRSDVYSPVKIGITETGQNAEISLFAQTVLVGGSPGSGKSGTAWALLAHAALDPRAVLVVIDLKPSGIETRPVHARADYIATTDDEAAAVLERIWLEVQQRNEKLAAAMLEKVPVPSDEYPPILIFCDEAAELTRAHSEAGKNALEYLTRIVAVGRASGVGVVIITQKPDSQVLPTALRDLMNQRLCLRVGNREQAKTILGDVPDGVEPWAIAASTQGRGYLRDSYGNLTLIQGVYMDRAAVVQMGKQAAALHEQLGRKYFFPDLPEKMPDDGPDGGQMRRRRRR